MKGRRRTYFLGNFFLSLFKVILSISNTFLFTADNLFSNFGGMSQVCLVALLRVLLLLLRLLDLTLENAIEDLTFAIGLDGLKVFLELVTGLKLRRKTPFWFPESFISEHYLLFDLLFARRLHSSLIFFTAKLFFALFSTPLALGSFLVALGTQCFLRSLLALSRFLKSRSQYRKFLHPTLKLFTPKCHSRKTPVLKLPENLTWSLSKRSCFSSFNRLISAISVSIRRSRSSLNLT